VTAAAASGRPASHRDVWRIAAPLILSNISVPLLGMVDTAVMGHLDEPWYLGAVAVGATIFSFLYTGVNFLRMGTTGLAAQACGANPVPLLVPCHRVVASDGGLGGFGGGLPLKRKLLAREGLPVA